MDCEVALGSWDLPFGYAREDTQKFQGLGWWVGGVLGILFSWWISWYSPDLKYTLLPPKMKMNVLKLSPMLVLMFQH